MSVRHIRARRGEHIVVHRNHGSFDERGCLTVIAIGVAIWLIASFWQIIIACAAVAIVLWMIWIFRKPLCKTICWIAKQLWRLIALGSTTIGKPMCSIWQKFKDWRNQNPTIPHSTSAKYNNPPADYGKIIQNRK